MTQGKHSESERTREHDRTTRMLLAIVSLFLITELPQVSGYVRGYVRGEAGLSL